jgi:hypothetical protein
MEELATLVPLNDTTMAADMYTALQTTLKTSQLKINMSALTTDGPPALLDNNGEVAAMINRGIQEQ